jgi:Flavodoxin domain
LDVRYVRLCPATFKEFRLRPKASKELEMRALVVYESMYGNTHAVAEGIADGLRPKGEVRLVAVGEATDELVSWADLVVVGGPTHVHGMTKPSSRKGAHDAAARPDSAVQLDDAADGPGIREWLAGLGAVSGKAGAAFDTRVSGPAFITGRASSGIANGLSGHGFSLVAKPQSFLVDRHNRLVAGEAERATRWARGLPLPVAATV